ncbi:PREDICTED: protachykinin-1 [Tinamus guttatus]|uniref:protachykinin-1 n=1 Tax=Tinamus guttatus TaxID=94827 RepID=UPI00052F0D15|nr:PREDICTED: protachykinin-1 [Tinamus guttatus]
MRLPLALAVLLLASAHGLPEEMGASDDLSYWPAWPEGYGQISHKRHKTDSFVGLMGKRSLNSGSSERSIAQSYERRRK